MNAGNAYHPIKDALRNRYNLCVRSFDLDSHYTSNTHAYKYHALILRCTHAPLSSGSCATISPLLPTVARYSCSRVRLSSSRVRVRARDKCRFQRVPSGAERTGVCSASVLRKARRHLRAKCWCGWQGNRRGDLHPLTVVANWYIFELKDAKCLVDAQRFP